MPNHLKPVLALTSAVLLAGCFASNDTERAILGGVIGCAVGEILDDGKCAAGAAVGAAGGALADDAGLVN